MAEVTDILETVLRLTGVDQYQQQMRAVAGSTEAFAAAENTALTGLARFGTNALGAVATLETLRRGIDGVNEAFQLFAEDDAISRRVAFALNQVKSSVPFSEFDKLAESISRATGFDDDLIRAQGEVLSRFNTTGEQITTLLPLIVDLAAREGKGIDEVTQAVGLGLEGQSRGLKRLGINFKATGDEAKNFQRILEQLVPFRGAAAETLQTPAGLLRQQTTEFENLQHAIGRRFAPTISQLLQGRNLLLQRATQSVESGAGGGFIDFLTAPFREAAEAGAAARRGDTAAGRAFRRLFPPPTEAAEAALQAPANSVQRTLESIEQNTKNTHRALLRGGSPAAQGAVSIRELNQALGVR